GDTDLHMASSTDRESWFQKLRAEWFREMRPMGSWIPWELRELVPLEENEKEHEDAEEASGTFWGEGLLHEAPQLGAEHLRDCVVLPERTDLLARLPHGGRVAEVGTLHGDFARQILSIVNPHELHVIDLEIRPEVREMAAEPASRGRVRVHE